MLTIYGIPTPNTAKVVLTRGSHIRSKANKDRTIMVPLVFGANPEFVEG